MNQQYGQLVRPVIAARYQQAAARFQQANAQRLADLQSSQSQMYGSFSGGGHGGYGYGMGSPGGSCFSIDICPDLILALITAAGAAAALGFYLAIVAAGKRRKRSLSGQSPWDWAQSLLQPLVSSMIGLGSYLQIVLCH